MTVKVFDRHEDSWLYERATRAVSEAGHLTLYAEDGTVVGGFNAASWTHYIAGDQADNEQK